jgi:hypothetical protein
MNIVETLILEEYNKPEPIYKSKSLPRTIHMNKIYENIKIIQEDVKFKLELTDKTKSLITNNDGHLTKS